MTQAGLQAFSLRKESNSSTYSYEKKFITLSPAYEMKFKEQKVAWDFFVRQAPSYQKSIIHWIMSAKQEKTSISRLEKTIRVSEQQKRLR
ncbi:YdeI/OmpD-associated family protein [Limibacter armeniacum]|uniref:YdeI/OmpD-associated family protein n=1 Tax=Limibacter armeniacum TaxID=466084 RepID=UPI002FE5A312